MHAIPKSKSSPFSSSSSSSASSRCDSTSAASWLRDRPLAVDVHTHVYLPRYMDILRGRAAARAIPYVVSAPGSGSAAERMVILPGEDEEKSIDAGRPLGSEYFDVRRKLAFMDRHGVQASVLSTANPWLDFLAPAEAVRVARLLNEDLQILCGSSLAKSTYTCCTVMLCFP